MILRGWTPTAAAPRRSGGCSDCCTHCSQAAAMPGSGCARTNLCAMRVNSSACTSDSHSANSLPSGAPSSAVSASASQAHSKTARACDAPHTGTLRRAAGCPASAKRERMSATPCAPNNAWTDKGPALDKVTHRRRPMSSAKLRDSHTPCPRQSPQGSPGRFSISSPVTCRSAVVGGTQMPQHPSGSNWFSASLKSHRPSWGSTGGCRMGMTSVRSHSGLKTVDESRGRSAALNREDCFMRTQCTTPYAGHNRHPLPH